MDPMYYDTITKLEEMGIDREYIQGWIGGFMNNPKREEQRLNEAYEAGYADGFPITFDLSRTLPSAM